MHVGLWLIIRGTSLYTAVIVHHSFFVFLSNVNMQLHILVKHYV